jgi:hypothetical protein
MMKKLLYVGIWIGLMGAPVLAQPGSQVSAAMKKHPEDLIADLRSDAIRWNAHCALAAILYYTSDEFRYNQKLYAALENALDSDDWQQRQIAADILRNSKDYQPTDRLVEVTVEGSRDDDLPGWFLGEGKMILLFNATEGMRYLLKHPKVGTPFLEAALESDELQQRFLAAFILGATGRAAKVERTVEILLPHLKNDSVRLNACLATHALYHLGKAAVPLLTPYRDGEDEQLRSAIRLILLDLESPPQTAGELLNRKKLHNLSPKKPDPAVKLWDDFIDIGWFPSGLVGKSVR